MSTKMKTELVCRFEGVYDRFKVKMKKINKKSSGH